MYLASAVAPCLQFVRIICELSFQVKSFTFRYMHVWKLACMHTVWHILMPYLMSRRPFASF